MMLKGTNIKFVNCKTFEVQREKCALFCLGLHLASFAT